MKVRFLSEADAEFRESARYYEDKAPGLGVAFIAEVHRVAAVVASQPSIGSPVDDELRKFVLRRFPYNVIYAVEAMRLSSRQSRITSGAHFIGQARPEMRLYAVSTGSSGLRLLAHQQ